MLERTATKIRRSESAIYRAVLSPIISRVPRCQKPYDHRQREEILEVRPIVIGVAKGNGSLKMRARVAAKRALSERSAEPVVRGDLSEQYQQAFRQTGKSVETIGREVVPGEIGVVRRGKRC